MKHALITGAAGFIGSHLVDALLEAGWRVTAVDNFDSYYSAKVKRENIHAHVSHAAYRLVEADICEMQQLHALVKNEISVIVHLAAKPGVRHSLENPKDYWRTNVSGTHNLLELAREYDIPQFVFLSSSSVYGNNPSLPWREEFTPSPISPYADTKLAAETLGAEYSRRFGIRWIALRPFTVYGPRQRPDLVIRKFAECLLRNERLAIFGDGTTSRDYTYIADVVKAIQSAMSYDASSCEVINIGYSRMVTLREMIESLSGVLGVAPTCERFPEQACDMRATFADIRKAQRLLGYAPTTDFQEGIALFAKWLISTRFTPSAHMAEVKMLASSARCAGV